MHVKLERTHTLDGVEKKKQGGIHLATTSRTEAIRQALEYASDGQVGMFGDTGMDDGEYMVKVLSIDGVPIPEEEKKEAGWKMV